MLVPIEQLDESVERSQISAEKLHPIAQENAPADTDAPSAKPASPTNILTVKENLGKRRQMLQSISQEPVDFAYERAIGKNDSVYSNFCELIAVAKRKVARIVIKKGNNPTGHATGFMVSDRLMLTNWHVFNSIADVADSEAEFFYELDIYGRSVQPIVFKLSGSDFFHSSRELDYCFVAVSPVDVQGTTQLNSIGYHYLDPTLGKLGEAGVELMNIIHHPHGDHKQLSIRENKFSKILNNTILYETDTAPGSSGSPVFNDQWQIVALHHKSVPSKTADGKNYLDKNGKIIEPVDNKIDITRVHWIANEGIRISVLVEDIFQKFPDNSFVENLKKKPPLENPAIFNNLPTDKIVPISENIQGHKNNIMDNDSTNNVQISFPAFLIEANGNITININNQPVSEKSAAKLKNQTDVAEQSADLLEIAKIDLENSKDYSNCKGYITNFLGVEIPFPKPKQALKKFVAKLKNNNQSVLNYHHFSVLFHSVRKMPIVSVINVDGNQDVRKDETERKDVWLRDNRLDYAIQLTDKFYASSGFDRGHLSRREDANWGDTAELAKEYADLTCVHTNACPQVPALNRSNRSGLWGKLESVILEKGVEKESGKSSKLTVFNGPIFASGDPVFKGIQIPLEFWKIILWFDKTGNLKATAFKLSQGNLVADIDFEKLDFDANPDYKIFQCSIESLEMLTKLELSYLAKFDTFQPTDANESLTVISEESFNESFTSESSVDFS